MVRLETTFSARDELSPDFAAEISNCAAKYQAAVTLKYGGKRLRLESLIGILSLDLRKGARVAVIAEGSDELAAAEEIRNILLG